MSKAVLESDVVVVGSGPGGASVALQMAKAGRRVILLEWGLDWRRTPLYGTHAGCLLYTDRSGLLFTREGLNIVRGIMTGGSTNLYCGTAARPPAWLQEKCGIDIEADVDETIRELKIGPLPEEVMGQAAKRVLDVANDLGLNWTRLPKFIDPDRCAHGFRCGAKCMLGCRCGAKWTANEVVDEARRHGCQVLTGVRVARVLHDGTKALGVVGTRRRLASLVVLAPCVILAAGGIGSPRILQRSGFPEAGQRMLMDPTVMVYGVAPGQGTYADPQMTVGSFDDSKGYILSHLIDPWLLYPIIMAVKGPRYVLTFSRYRHTLGIMIKVKDELAGGVYADGSISKPMTGQDRERLDHAERISCQILIRAGCDPSSVFTTPIRGTHPSGTVRIGEMLDKNLKVKGLDHLYVCDASVFPEAMDRPIVLTVIGLAKRLARHLLASEPTGSRQRSQEET